MSLSPPDFSSATPDLFARIARQLSDEPHKGSGCAEIDDQFDYSFDRPPRAAAVMLAFVERGGGSDSGQDVSVLYTRRAAQLRDHSGQIAFPGGKIDADDATPFEAARREAHEEVALLPDDVRFLGYLPTYHTGTNYLVTPVVVHARPRADFVANPGEVDDIFEVPLAHLMRDDNYQMKELKFPTKDPTAPLRKTWKIDFERHQIWGITANITRMLYTQVLTQIGDIHDR